MQKKKSNKNKRTKNKVLKIILISLVVFTLLFLCIFTYFVHLILDPEQSYNTESLTPQHILHQSEVIKRLTNLLYQSKPGRVCVLTLNQAEVNAIIAAISNSDSLIDFLWSAGKVGQAPKKRPYKVIFKENRFDIKYSFPIDFSTPFGKHINLTLSGKPGINREGVHLDIKSVSAGDLPLPPRQVEKILHNLLRTYEKDEIFKRIHKIIVKAYITPDNNLVIYFYPYRIKNVLTEGF
jgi:uncharacterized protein YpmS